MELSVPHESVSPLRGSFGYSALFHVFLFGALAVSTVFSHTGEVWGGAGGEGTMNVNLVGSIPAVPLPKPEVVTTNRVVDTTKGLYKEEPPPKPVEEKDAVAIPKFDRDKKPEFLKPKPPAPDNFDQKPEFLKHPSRVLENPTPPPPNAIPYGRGGAPQIPESSFSLTKTTGGGLGISGTSGGSFGTQFPWYVEAVQRRVSSNWLESTIDPTVSFAPRCVVTFEILRNGQITNIQVTQSSGDNSVDTSAVRAVRNSNPLDNLPAGYNGSYVVVQFWFDFHRQ